MTSGGPPCAVDIGNDMEALGWVLLRVALATLLVYFAIQAVTSIPMISAFLMNQQPGRLVVHLLTIGTMGVLIWYMPALRLLHEFGLIRDAKAFLWPDIALSALALAQVSRLWPKVFDWLERQAG